MSGLARDDQQPPPKLDSDRTSVRRDTSVEDALRAFVVEVFTEIRQQHRTSEAKLAFTVAETAELLGVSASTVRRLISAGDLPAVQLSDRKRWVIPAVPLKDWLEGQRAGGDGQTTHRW